MEDDDDEFSRWRYHVNSEGLGEKPMKGSMIEQQIFKAASFTIDDQ
jgi:hypothetical protein